MTKQSDEVEAVANESQAARAVGRVMGETQTVGHRLWTTSLWSRVTMAADGFYIFAALERWSWMPRWWVFVIASVNVVFGVRGS